MKEMLFRKCIFDCLENIMWRKLCENYEENNIERESKGSSCPVFCKIIKILNNVLVDDNLVALCIVSK